MSAIERTSLPRGVFTLSLDFELIWGTLDLFGPDGFRRQCLVEREVVVDRLLALFTELEIPATWLVVGHLFLDRCERQDGRKHPDVVPPNHAWCRAEWFSHDPDATEAEAPLFLGRSLVEKIHSCRVPQEVGSHSFSHVIFGDPGCSEETARTEIDACVRAAGDMGLVLESFAYPRNSVGYPELLARAGFSCFRGPEPVWYHGAGIPEKVRRLGHLAAVLTATSPPTVMPKLTPAGLVDLPGSMVYFPAHGLRRFVPMGLRVRRAEKGLDAAARTRRVFHLWMHPTNLVDETERMMAGFRAILERAVALRAAGRLDIQPMRVVAAMADRVAA